MLTVIIQQMLRKLADRNQDTNCIISLPAAVFNRRSPLKASKIGENIGMVGNVPVITNMGLSRKMGLSNNGKINCSTVLSDRCFGEGPCCLNHQQKSAKFYIVNDQDEQKIYYCEKCAILLASQGFKVTKYEEVSRKNEQIVVKPTRQEHLKGFISSTTTKMMKLTDKLKQQQNLLENSQKEYQSNIERINKFFQSLFQTLKRHKNKCLHTAKQDKMSKIGFYKENILTCKEGVQILKSMKEDIQGAYDSIVNDTSQEDYQTVMSHYIKTQSQIEIKERVSGDEPFLPDIEQIEVILGNIIGNKLTQTHFSFDTSTKTYT